MRYVLVMGFALGIFLLSAFVMYIAWVSLEDLSTLARGVASLFSFIFAFSASTLVFWKVIQRMTVTEVVR